MGLSVEFTRNIKILFSITLAGVALALGACSKAPAEKSEEARPVLVAPVHYETLSPQRSFVGTIRPRPTAWTPSRSSSE